MPDPTEGAAGTMLNPALPDEFDLDRNWTDTEGEVSFGGVVFEDAETGVEIKIDPNDAIAMAALTTLRADWLARMGVSLEDPDEEHFINVVIPTGQRDPDGTISVIWEENYHLVTDEEHGVAYLVSEVSEQNLEDYPGCGKALHELGFVLDGLPDADGIQSVYYVTALVPDDMPLGAVFTPEDQTGLVE